MFLFDGVFADSFYLVFFYDDISMRRELLLYQEELGGIYGEVPMSSQDVVFLRWKNPE